MSKDATAKLKRLETICKWMEDPKRKCFTAQELATKCGVSQRSVLRDMALIKEAGLALVQDRGKCSVPFGFSFAKLGVTPQTAATLCVAYETAKAAGKKFDPACRYIYRILSDNRAQYKINPRLENTPITLALKKAVKQKRYVKIITEERTIYARPYCFIRVNDNVFLIFTTSVARFGKRGAAYRLDSIALKWIKEVCLAVDADEKNCGLLPASGIAQWKINNFLREYFGIFYDKKGAFCRLKK